MGINKVLQNGIYYKDSPFDNRNNGNKIRNNSFAIILIRILEDNSSLEVRESLTSLWKMLKHLEKGQVYNLANHQTPSGNLSTLIGYTHRIFKLSGVTKVIPKDFEDMKFLSAIPGNPILHGSGINYSHDRCESLSDNNHIAIQFIAKTQLGVYRALVETWKHIRSTERNATLEITSFFTGFQRDDGRSWLGFHDEVSNLAGPRERKRAIVIDKINNNLIHRDFWTEGGTYLAFLRIAINLENWEKVTRQKQELIIGRDKLTGTPLVGVDKNGNPVMREKSRSSKVKLEIRKYRDHPDYFQKPTVSKKIARILDMESSSSILSQSHIGRARHFDQIDSGKPTSRRIYRQGFEFIERTTSPEAMPFRLGLNFVSFQNDPGRLFFILTDPNWLGNSNFGGIRTEQMDDIFSTDAAGLFFVPPNEQPFPGASMFA